MMDSSNGADIQFQYIQSKGLGKACAPRDVERSSDTSSYKKVGPGLLWQNLQCFVR